MLCLGEMDSSRQESIVRGDGGLQSIEEHGLEDGRDLRILMLSSELLQLRDEGDLLVEAVRRHSESEITTDPEGSWSPSYRTLLVISHYGREAFTPDRQASFDLAPPRTTPGAASREAPNGTQVNFCGCATEESHDRVVNLSGMLLCIAFQVLLTIVTRIQ